MQQRIINPSFAVAGFAMSRIWHCFGNYMHEVNLTTIQKMLEASHTNVLPINTHLLTEQTGRDGLLIGFGGVRFDELAKVLDLSQMTLMLNINHQITAIDAVEKTRLAYNLTSEKVIKLEVLNIDLKTSNDVELIHAVTRLKKEFPELVLMPLLSNNFQIAKTLVDLGCPLLRVMGSAIGDARGILDVAEFEKICSLPVPIVLDGGVRDMRDLKQAMELGAQGCLVNSALFLEGNPPDAGLTTFLLDSQVLFNSSTKAFVC